MDPVFLGFIGFGAYYIKKKFLKNSNNDNQLEKEKLYNSYFQQNFLTNNNEMFGGYYLSDKSNPGFFLYELNKILEKYPKLRNGRELLSNPRGNSDFDVQSLFTLFETDDYKKIFQTLIKKFFDNTSYIQQLGSHKHYNVYPYHINFGAIMFLSFILELEIFCLLRVIKGYNTVNSLPPKQPQINDESCKSVWDQHDSTDTYPFYRRILSQKSLIQIAEYFTNQLDDLFFDFMKALTISLREKKNLDSIDGTEEILRSICYTTTSYESGFQNKRIFDFIYVDWKARLIEKFQFTTNEINTIIMKQLKEIINNESKYVADGFGFFSMIFLAKADLGTLKKYYGSCVSSSLFECYIMSRLHIHGKNINLIIESEDGLQHAYWIKTQEVFNNRPISHWATQFTIEMPDSQGIKLRQLFPAHRFSVPFIRDEKPNNNFLKACIYPVLEYFKTFVNKCHHPPDSELIRKISTFIDKRITLLEYMLDNNGELPSPSIVIPEFSILKDNLKTNLSDQNIEYLRNTPVEIINTDLNIRGQTILYEASRSGNLELVKILLDIPGINLNVKTNPLNDTPLHGAAYGFDHDFMQTSSKRREIIRLLVRKGADKSIKNNYDRTYMNNYRF